MSDEPKLLDGAAGDAARKMLGSRPERGTDAGYRGGRYEDDYFESRASYGRSHRDEVYTPPPKPPVPRFRSDAVASTVSSSGFRYFSTAIPTDIRINKSFLHESRGSFEEITVTVQNSPETMSDLVDSLRKLADEIERAALFEKAKAEAPVTDTTPKEKPILNDAEEMLVQGQGFESLSDDKLREAIQERVDVLKRVDSRGVHYIPLSIQIDKMRDELSKRATKRHTKKKGDA